VLLADVVALFKVCDRAGDFEDAVVGAGGESETVGNEFQKAIAGGIQFAVFADKARRHLGVRMDFQPFEPLQLQVAGAFDPRCYGGGAFAVGPVGKIAVFDRRDFDVDIYPVHERTGYSGAVAVDVARGTGAGVGRIAEIAAGTGVECGDQHQPRRIGDGCQSTGDCDPAVFERLAEHFENMFLELGEFIQEKYPVMRERYLSGLRGISAVISLIYCERLRLCHGM